MFIPNIWENKTCSKPTSIVRSCRFWTSCHPPAPTCESQGAEASRDGSVSSSQTSRFPLQKNHRRNELLWATKGYELENADSMKTCRLEWMTKPIDVHETHMKYNMIIGSNVKWIYHVGGGMLLLQFRKVSAVYGFWFTDSWILMVQ